MQPLGDFLKEHRFGDAFRDWYFLPMLGCIWSCPTDQMLKFPVATMIRFCHNHGLIQVANRPQWWTVAGGAQLRRQIVAGFARQAPEHPVRRIERDAAGVRVSTDQGTEHFDHVVLATHSATSPWRCWRNPRRRNVRCWAPSATSPTAPCCTPTPRCCRSAAPPGRPGTTSAPSRPTAESPPACACTTCSTSRSPAACPARGGVAQPGAQHQPAQVIGEFEYAHPVFDLALAAQSSRCLLQGQHHTWFCGAWTGYGFHEDGLQVRPGAAPTGAAAQLRRGGWPHDHRAPRHHLPSALIGFGQVRHGWLRPPGIVCPPFPDAAHAHAARRPGSGVLQ